MSQCNLLLKAKLDDTFTRAVPLWLNQLKNQIQIRIYPFVKRGRLFVSSLSSCREKATVALYFGRIFTFFGVTDFQVFWLLL